MCVYPAKVEDTQSFSLALAAGAFGSSVALGRHSNFPRLLEGEGGLYASVHPFHILPLENGFQTSAFQPFDFNARFTAQVVELLARDCLDIEHFCKAYFSILSARLPIIDKEQFYMRLSSLCSQPDANFSLLLLCMSLVTRRSIKPDDSNQPGTLYFTAKSFHTLLSSLGRLSLDLVQAGLLIALYEYCHALLETASLSIWTCAKMGYTPELDKTLNHDFGNTSTTTVRLQSGRCVWWGIYIL